MVSGTGIEVINELDRLLDKAIDANSRAFSLRTSAAAELAATACEELAAREDLSPLDRDMWARSGRNWRLRVVERAA